jgi:cytochrome d ubiquinol oxidase subunit II
MGNVLQGVPFRFNDDLMVFYEGNFFGLLNPFALLAGIVSLSMLVMHGASWLNLKTEGAVQQRAQRIGSIAALVVIVTYALAGVWLAVGISAYEFTSVVPADGPSNPLLNEVARQGSWMAAYSLRPWIVVAPILGFAGAALTYLGLRAGREISTLLFSGLAIIGVISSVGLTMFPFILPSSIDPKSSLAVWNASSSHQTLFVMVVSAVIFVPIILAYTAWVYKVMWGKVTVKSVTDASDVVY